MASKRINVHVTADDVPILEAFKASGGNVSELLREQLHRWAALERLRGEHDLIELDMVRAPNKAFYGAWIWKETEYESQLGMPIWVKEGVAQTKKGRFLHYMRFSDHAVYKVYETLDDIDNLRIRHLTDRVLRRVTRGPELLDI